MVSFLVRVNPKALFYASASLRESQKFIASFIKKKPEVLAYASEKLRDNEEFVMKLIKKRNLVVYSYASDRLRHNKDFMTKALQRGGETPVAAPKSTAQKGLGALGTLAEMAFLGIVIGAVGITIKYFGEMGYSYFNQEDLE